MKKGTIKRLAAFVQAGNLQQVRETLDSQPELVNMENEPRYENDTPVDAARREHATGRTEVRDEITEKYDARLGVLPRQGGGSEDPAAAHASVLEVLRGVNI